MWGKAGFVTEPAIRGQFGFEHLHISAETLGSPIEGSFVLFRGSPLVVVRLAVAVACLTSAPMEQFCEIA